MFASAEPRRPEGPQPPAAASRADCSPGSRCCDRCALIVEDDAVAAAGQMRRGAFLVRVERAVAESIDVELAGTGLSSRDCPYLAQAMAQFRNRPAAYLEQFARRYTGSASASPEQLVSAIRQRVVAGARAWRAGGTGAAPPTLVAPGGGARPFVQPMRDDGRPAAALDDASALVARLGRGEPLAGGVRARMERAFGVSFSQVRVHDGLEAQRFNDEHQARALTIGDHVALSRSVPALGTLAADVILAHELAHTLQQRRGGIATGDLTALERDADRSALAALLPAPQGATPLPAVSGGLRLSRCAVAAVPAIEVAAGAGAGAGTGIGLGTILSALGLTAITTLESDTPRPQDCATGYPGVPECWEIDYTGYDYASPQAALAALKASTGNPGLSLEKPRPTTSGPCDGTGTHWNVGGGAGGAYPGSIVCCPCCLDEPGGPVMAQKCRIV